MRRILILACYPIHLIPEFGSIKHNGTYATWLPQLVDNFERDCDLDIHWLVFSKSVSAQKEVRFKGQTFHVLPRKKLSLQACTMYVTERAKVKKIISYLAPDVVHAWGTEEGYGLCASDFEGHSILSMQGIMSYYCKIVKSPHWLQRLQACYERYVFKRIKSITCESKWGIGILKDLGVQVPIIQIEHGVHPNFYEAKWSPLEEVPCAFFAGSVSEAKGVGDLVDAFSRPELAKYKLMIAGDGPMMGDIAKMKLPNVELLGRIPQNEIIEHLERSWCLVHPTRVDTSPNVVKEARVVGLPVVTTPCGGQSDYIEDGRNGQLVNPGDIEKLVRALSSILSDLEVCKQFGMTTHERERDYFNSAHTAERLKCLYNE